MPADVKDLDSVKIEALDIRQLEVVIKQLRHLAAKGGGDFPQRTASLLQKAESLLAEKRNSVAANTPANRRIIFGEQPTAEFGGGGGLEEIHEKFHEKFYPSHHAATGYAEIGGQQEGGSSWDDGLRRVYDWMSPVRVEASSPVTVPTTIRGAVAPGSGSAREGEAKTVTPRGWADPRDRLAEEPIMLGPPTSRI